MNETLMWMLGFILNLVGVFFIVIQTRVSLERRIATLETYMRIMVRDKGISVRASDTMDLTDERR